MAECMKDSEQSHPGHWGCHPRFAPHLSIQFPVAHSPSNSLSLRQIDPNIPSAQQMEFSEGIGNEGRSEDTRCFDIRMDLSEINLGSQEKRHQEEIMRV